MGLHLYFEADPPSAKPTLLLVHGLLSSRNHWLPNLESLRRVFRTVSIDLPAHGRSVAPLASEPLAPDSLVQALDDVRNRLGLTDWALCGQSFGAGLTLRYALALPYRVRFHIFTNASVAVSDMTPAQVLSRWAPRLPALRAGKHDALAQEPLHPSRAHRWPAELRDCLSRDAAGMDPKAYAALIEGTLAHLPLGPHLAMVRPPCLLVNGRNERRFQPYRAGLTEMMPQLKIIDLPGGHSINIDNPEGFNTAVLAFAAEQQVFPGGMQ
jgi:pimeloyl-ACP methyl ester carboxylesterase